MGVISENCLENAYDVLDLREVTSGFWGLGLLFGKESSEGDDVGVDVLLADRRRAAVVRHCGLYGRMCVRVHKDKWGRV